MNASKYLKILRKESRKTTADNELEIYENMQAVTVSFYANKISTSLLKWIVSSIKFFDEVCETMEGALLIDKSSYVSLVLIFMRIFR